MLNRGVSLRRNFSFLRTGEEVNKKFKEILNELKSRHDAERDKLINIGYIEYFSNLKWVLDKEELRESIRHLYAASKMHRALRPNIPIYTNKRFSYALKNHLEIDFNLISANEYIEIFPTLFFTYSWHTYFEVPYLSLTQMKVRDYYNILKSSYFEKRFNLAKERGIKAIFRNHNKVKIESSGDYWIIFLPFPEGNELINLDEDPATIDIHRMNTVIFGRKIGFNKLLRKRLIRASIISFAHKILLRESVLFLRNNLTNCNDKIKNEFPFYFTSELNYKAHSIEHDSVPELLYSRYQREVYTKIAKSQNYDVEYSKSLNDLAKYLAALDFNKQIFYSSRDGFASSIIRDLIVSTLDETIIELDNKEEVVFDVLLKEYKRDKDNGKHSNIGARTVNEIMKYAEKKGGEFGAKFTSQDFYPTPGPVLTVLLKINLVKEIPIKKGAAKQKYAVNDDNSYVKRKILSMTTKSSRL